MNEQNELKKLIEQLTKEFKDHSSEDIKYFASIDDKLSKLLKALDKHQQDAIELLKKLKK